jgi:hypothetical protein
MRQIQHLNDGADKILNIETEGCTINVVIGTHDPNGIEFTTVEITPHEPDDHRLQRRHCCASGRARAGELFLPRAGGQPARTLTSATGTRQ